MRYQIGLAIFLSLAGTSTAICADFSLPMCPERIAPAKASSGAQYLGKLEFVRRDREAVNFPEVDEITSVEIGQSMIYRLNYSILPGTLILKKPLHFQGKPPETNRRGLFSKKSRNSFIVDVPAGRYQLTPRLSEYVDLPAFSVESQIPYREKDHAPYPKGKIGIFPVSSGVELFWGIDRGLWSSGILSSDYDLEYCAHWQEGDFRRELIYSGISQGTVSILYREFSNDLARPAFSQELKYDLSQGSEVGFRGARFEILNASNTQIQFRVLATLN